MCCPYFREGYFGICVAPDAIHVPGIAELEKFCFRKRYKSCPSFSCTGYSMYLKRADDVEMNTDAPRR